MIKFGILVVLHPKPGYHTRFSDGARNVKRRDLIESTSHNVRRSSLGGIIGGKSSNEAQIAIGVAYTLGKMWPAPDAPGAAYWK